MADQITIERAVLVRAAAALAAYLSAMRVDGPIHKDTVMARIRGADKMAHPAYAELYAALHPEPAAAIGVDAPVERNGPEFTDWGRAALLWVLWHHQGGSSKVGQPIRFALGMGAHDRLNEHQIADAKRWAEFSGSTAASGVGVGVSTVPDEAQQEGEKK